MALASEGVGGGPPVAPDRSLEPIPRPGCGLQRRVSADRARSSVRGSPPRLSSPDARTGTGEHSGQLPPRSAAPPSPLRLMGLLTCPVRQPSAHLRLRTSLPGNPERPRAKAAGHDAAEVGLGGERSLLSHYFVDGV